MISRVGGHLSTLLEYGTQQPRSDMLHIVLPSGYLSFFHHESGGKGLGILVAERARGTRDKTNHMALYTQKFIAADYLAKVQTQTHFFLRPLVGRAVRNGEREEWTKGASETGREEGRSETRNSEEWREDTVSERAKASTMGAGRRAFRLFFPSLPFVACSPIRSSPRLNLAETGDFSAKTCIAFYCQIDHLNNSQHSNPSPTTRCPILLFLFPFLTFSLFLFMLHRLHL